jgi:hypothetical protein
MKKRESFIFGKGLDESRGGRSVAKFVRGDVVVIPFSFSDLSQSKRRPALIVAQFEGKDVILCQITSKNIKHLADIARLVESHPHLWDLLGPELKEIIQKPSAGENKNE